MPNVNNYKRLMQILKEEGQLENAAARTTKKANELVPRRFGQGALDADDPVKSLAEIMRDRGAKEVKDIPTFHKDTNALIPMNAMPTDLSQTPLLQKPDAFLGAPVRTAIREAQKGNFADALSAAANQFGKNPDLAPTGEDIVKAAGVPEGTPSKIAGGAMDILSDPSMYVPIPTRFAGLKKLIGR